MPVVLQGDLPGPVPLTENAVALQLPPGRWVQAVSDLFPAHRPGSNLKRPLPPRLTDQVLQYKFPHGTAADIAVAYE